MLPDIQQVRVNDCAGAVIALRPLGRHIFHADPAHFHATPQHAAGSLPLHQLHFVAGLQVADHAVAGAGAGTDTQILCDHLTKDGIRILPGLHVITTVAAALLSRAHILPGAVAMAQSSRVAVPIAVAAAGARMLRVALLLTGRRHHSGFIHMGIRYLLQIAHGSIAADATVLHMGPMAVAGAGGLGDRHRSAGGDGADDAVARTVTAADQQVRIGGGAQVGAGVLLFAIAMTAAMRIGIVGHIPIGCDIFQNIALGAVFSAQPGLSEGNALAAVAFHRVGAVENIAFIAHKEHSMRQLATVKHDALRMLVQHSLQTGNADTGGRCVADGDAGAFHPVGETPAQTYAVHPGGGPQGGFRYLTPVFIFIYVKAGAQHHGRRAEGAGTADQLGQVQTVRQVRAGGGRRHRQAHRQQRQHHCQAQ